MKRMLSGRRESAAALAVARPWLLLLLRRLLPPALPALGNTYPLSIQPAGGTIVARAAARHVGARAAVDGLVGRRAA